MTTIQRRRTAGVLAILTIAVAGAAGAGGQESKGDLWESTTQMSMEGLPFKMPANTAKVCSFKEWKEPPGGSDKSRNCKSSNMRTTGNKVTWDVQCTGPTMTGKGELVREGTDAYTGALALTSAEGNMTIQLKGKKVGGCDNPQ
jgi:hypothetical protein